MPDDAAANIAGGPFPHLRVEAGPALASRGSAHPSHMGYNVAVRIDHADRGDSIGIERFLSAGFPQHVLGAKYRWSVMVLALEKRCSAGQQLKRRPAVLMVVKRVHGLCSRVSAVPVCRVLVVTLMNVATILSAAPSVPRTLPATFQAPPRRRRQRTEERRVG